MPVWWSLSPWRRRDSTETATSWFSRRVPWMHAHAVHDHLAAAIVGVLDGPLPVAPDDGAGVAHLSARLRIGRRAIEDDLDGLA